MRRWCSLIMASQRIQYPSRAFDMAHCSRCLVPWKDYDGVYLIEMDRVLRPRGYWILSVPPIDLKKHHRGWKRTTEDLKQEQDAIEDVANILYWKKVLENGDLAIWQKPMNHIDCVKSIKVYKVPHICRNDNPDAAWYRKLETCVTPLTNVNDVNEVAGGPLEKWSKRVAVASPRIRSGSIPRVTTTNFNEDSKLWTERVANYNKLTRQLGQGRYRNIMDMNAGLGGFVAALANDPVWVMNVVPSDDKHNTLGVIYEQGLIGTYEDWCEAFSTYPRTYDLIHSTGLLSMYQDRCDISDIVLEMDYILRHEGTVIFRDTVDVLVKVESLIGGIRWLS